MFHAADEAKKKIMTKCRSLFNTEHSHMHIIVVQIMNNAWQNILRSSEILNDRRIESKSKFWRVSEIDFLRKLNYGTRKVQNYGDVIFHQQQTLPVWSPCED